MSIRRLGLVAGPIAFAAILLAGPPGDMVPEAQRVGAVASLMAIWWVTEALPLAATALLPIALFPATGVLSPGEVTRAYGNHLIFLFMGGFFIAVTMQRWDLHRRIALHTVRLVGVRRDRMVLGFMLATAGLSMWISNTATAMMMLPIALAVAQQADGEGAGHRFGFGTVLMLGVAYAASIGGVATLIGTPPNAILAGMAEELYGISIDFARWMLFGVPLSALMLVVAWVLLLRLGGDAVRGHLSGGREAIREQLTRLGPIGRPELGVLGVFALVAGLWIFGGLLPEAALGLMNDASIAVLGAVLLFLLPAGQGERLLDWPTAASIPWDIIILFGGGFALATGFEQSGLSAWLAQRLDPLGGAPVMLVVLAVTLLVIFLTEITSNTATATLFVPLMGSFALAADIQPLVLMVAAAVAASCAFMLPVATPPNAVVFGSRRIGIRQMALAGLMLNVVAAAAVTVAVVLGLPLVPGLAAGG